MGSAHAVLYNQVGEVPYNKRITADGITAADGKLYLTLKNGLVICLGETGKNNDL